MTTTAPANSAQETSRAQTTPLLDDDDEIVYPVSSESSEASTPPISGDPRDACIVSSSGSTAASLPESFNNGDNMKCRDEEGINGVPFLDDLVLERGDAGSKVWVPPLPTMQRQRPRGRGHRSTKSEPLILPSAPTVRERQVALKPVKESWADDMKGLEAQMARASIGGPTGRSRSTPGGEGTRVLQTPSSTPGKQRSQKKQKANRSRGASAPGQCSNSAKPAMQSYPSPAPSPSPTRSTASGTVEAPHADSMKKKKAKKGKSITKAKKDTDPRSAPSTALSTPRGLGRRSIVDDVSENGDAMLPPQSLGVNQSDADRLLGIAYEEAVKFMNAFIENPDYYTSQASRLLFLQALIVELGLVSATGPERALPESLTAAKALLKSHAFLNVKDYLSLREKGLDALRSAMRPSRSALIRDLKGRNGRRAKLGWVKETGLSVLLVSCQY